MEASTAKLLFNSARVNRVQLIWVIFTISPLATALVYTELYSLFKQHKWCSYSPPFIVCIKGIVLFCNTLSYKQRFSAANEKQSSWERDDKGAATLIRWSRLLGCQETQQLTSLACISRTFVNLISITLSMLYDSNVAVKYGDSCFMWSCFCFIKHTWFFSSGDKSHYDMM